MFSRRLPSRPPEVNKTQAPLWTIKQAKMETDNDFPNKEPSGRFGKLWAWGAAGEGELGGLLCRMSYKQREILSGENDTVLENSDSTRREYLRLNSDED